jgi:hypothetical protein
MAEIIDIDHHLTAWRICPSDSWRDAADCRRMLARRAHLVVLLRRHGYYAPEVDW